MPKKTLLALALGLTSLSSFAAHYYVVVPAPNRMQMGAAGDTAPPPPPPPVMVSLYSVPLPEGVVGSAYSADLTHALQVTGDPAFNGSGVTWRVASGTLPAGLTLSGGVISGVPTAAEQQSFTVEVGYKNASGVQSYELVTLKIDVSLAGGSLPTGVVGSAYSADLNALLSVTGDPSYNGSGVTWRITAGKLPAGLSLNNGVISGTPTAGELQNITVEAVYRTKAGQQVYQVSTLAIAVGLAGASLPQPVVGSPYSYDLKQQLSVTGDPSYDGSGVTWRIVSGTLPAGLGFSNGVITGTPTGVESKSVVVEASYRTKAGQQTYQFVSLDIGVALASATIPSGVVGVAYSYDLNQQLQVTGDPAFNANGVTWRIVSGTLPSGLSFANGMLTGTPTGAASQAVKFEASYKTKSGQQTYQVVALNILVSLSTATLPGGTVGVGYSYDLKSKLQVAGDPDYNGSGVTWRVAQGTLPAGLSLDNGVISGTPTAAASGSVVVEASYRNKAGQQTYQLVTLNVAVSLAAMTPPQAIVGDSYSFSVSQLLSVTGDPAYTGTGVTWQLVSGTLPAGLTFSNGVISGTPTAAAASQPITVSASYRSVTGQQTYQLVSLNIAVGLSTSAIPPAIKGKDYAGFDFKPLVNVTGDTGYSVDQVIFKGSNIPGGMTLSNTGVLGGTPSSASSAGGVAFQVTADYKTKSGLQTYTIVVNDVTLQATQISVGTYSACAVTTAGGVKCWGKNDYGQLGDKTLTWRYSPVDVSGLSSGVISVAVGTYHACAILTGGGVKCWGYNSDGELGDGSITNRTEPVAVSGLSSGVTALTLGVFHSCALSGGQVLCWGRNNYGQLGDGTTQTRATPTLVSSLGTGVSNVDAGDFHTCATTSGGGAKCWGYNTTYALGDGSSTNRNAPVDVSGLTSGVASVSGGSEHSCAVLNGGGVKCWGGNSYGKLGDGTTTNRMSPINVVGLLSGASKVRAGNQHTCAVTTGGGVLCWGYNGNGQLGDASATNRSTPVSVVGMGSGISDVSAGYVATCAIGTDNSTKCWGQAGYLGNNSSTAGSTTPIGVVP